MAADGNAAVTVRPGVHTVWQLVNLAMQLLRQVQVVVSSTSFAITAAKLQLGSQQDQCHQCHRALAVSWPRSSAELLALLVPNHDSNAVLTHWFSAVLRLQGFTPKVLVFVTPLFFGLCHLHHGWGMVQCYGWSVRIAAICFLQFLYTTVFGWYASWLFISTGSTVAAVLVHSLCNVMGLPPFTQMTRSQGIVCVVGAVWFGVVAPRVLQPSESGVFWWSQCC